MASIEDILQFWFGDPEDPNSEYGEQRQVWFRKDPQFDQTICDRFFSTYQAAAQGELQSWQTEPHSCLALILLLDQFPRNMFRGTAQAFATDDQALAIAQFAIAHHYDQQLHPVERIFVYLPLEHSENLEHQTEAVRLFEQLAAVEPQFASTLDYAVRHRDVIAQFGHFPHRNTILGRETTPAEAEFLQQPGSSF
ncbi:MAG: DUF924 family protein [Thainema sp.]